MDRRTLRNKKNKSRNARPYDRPNQSILGKVASKVKGLFNSLPWLSASQEEPNSTDTPDEESADEEDIVHQSTSSHGSKRPRLSLLEPAPAILSEGTQTWLDTPSSSNLFNQGPHLPSTVTQSNLIENKESPVIMNGDDHSENSEGSASTSGCSSLVSSHKERSNCLGPSNLRLSETALANLRGNFKNVIGLKNRRDVTSQREGLSPNTSASRLSLWSGSRGFSPAAKFHRSPSVANSSQPGFNVSAFVGPSKVNQHVEKKVASPFYQGQTTFGGASASRRMPVSVTPYQVDKQQRNQIRVRSNQPDDTMEGMSSAAKRILLTLEKMSSPDAKKIPTTTRSPVDLSLYMLPPKHRSNVVSTPTRSSKGPPIANISTISKLTTLKSCGLRKFQNSSMESIPAPSEEKNKTESFVQSLKFLQVPTVKSGGGKIRSKLHQQHQSSAGSNSLEQLEAVSLPSVPLPITTLPTFSFDNGLSVAAVTKSGILNKIGNDFTFSNPIEVLPKSTLAPVQSNISVTNLDSNIYKSSSCQEKQAFTFSSPIEHELPAVAPSVPGGVFNTNLPSTWECSSCWVRNPQNKSKCMACETPRSSLNTTEPLQMPAEGTSLVKTTSTSNSNFMNPPSTWECSSCWVRNLLKEVKCRACETPRSSPTTTLPASNPMSTNASGGFSSNLTKPSSTWECSSCWVRNPNDHSKCMACETPRPGAKMDESSSAVPKSSISAFNIASSASSGFFTSALSSAKSSTGGFKLPEFSCESTEQTVSFGGFKIPAAKPLSSELNKSAEISDSKDVFTSKLSQISKNSPSSTDKGDLSSTKTASKPASNAKREETDSANLNGPSNISLATEKSSSVEGFSSGPEKGKTNSMLNFKSTATTQSSHTTTPSIEKPLSTKSNWECDICFVSNPPDLRKCSACETLRPSKSNMTVLKDPESFKLSSPFHNSPITFKFNSSSTSQITTTTASTETFTFGTASSATTSTFLTPVSNSISKNPVSSLGETKPAPLAEIISTPKQSVPEFKFDTPKLPSTDSAISNTPVVDLVKKSEKVDVNQPTLFNAPVTQNTTDESNLPTSTSSSGFKITSMAAGTTFSTLSSAENKWPLSTPTKEETSAIASQPSDSKKFAEIFSSGQSKETPVGGFNFKLPSSTTSIFGGFSAPVSSTDTKELIQVSTSQSFQSKENAEEKKSNMPFVMNASAASLSFPPATSSMFKIRDKLKETKTTETSLVKNVQIPSTATTTTTAPTFNFSSTPIPFPVFANSSQPGVSNTSGQTPSSTNVDKNQELKIVASVAPFSAAASSSTFSFGNPVTTTQSNPSSGFSFFTSTAANSAPTSTPSLFTFGASSNNTQTSQPGGFTFKRMDEEKPNPVSSNSLNLNASATTATSSLFKFNPSVPASTGGFVFGAVKSEPAVVSTAPANFAFGSAGTTPATNSTFSGFQTNTSATPVFQFGSQSTGGTAAGAPAFGAATSSFAFGKTEPTNQVPTTQASSTGFGPTMQSMFGATPPAAPAFGKPDKPAFNFGMPQSSSTPVFQFGGEKKQATASQFPFGNPSQEAAGPNSFSTPQFNITTPTSFNFGAASTQSGPFQFAASSDSQSSAPRKIKRALRRGQRKE